MERRRVAAATLIAATFVVCGLFKFDRIIAAGADAAAAILSQPIPPRTLPAFAADTSEALTRALEYLASAQQSDGGFGAGLHSAQDIRNPLAVRTDPATTAFAAQAFLRAGSTLHDGPYHAQLRGALDYLLEAVETSTDEAPSITNLQGTQPQSKLGQDVDVAFTAQLLGRVLPMTNNSLRERTLAALDKCARKLAKTQGADGSWNNRGTWAGTLQSAMALSALEAAQTAGLEGFDEAVRRGSARQQGDLDLETGRVSAGSAAGVELYAITSAQRAAAPQARTAREAIDEAKKAGRLEEDAAVSAEALEGLGYEPEEAGQLADAFERNRTATEMLRSDRVLQGFGSNGGEEYLSYMMTSESLFLTDRSEYNAWHQKMAGRLFAIQNANGSWSGHHCITSPVFCTAAVILMLTTSNDEQLLSQADH